MVRLCIAYEPMWECFCKVAGRKYVPSAKRQILQAMSEMFGDLRCDISWIGERKSADRIEDVADTMRAKAGGVPGDRDEEGE